MSERKTSEEFIKNAKKVHGNNFDYSEAIYKDNKTKLKRFMEINMIIPWLIMMVQRIPSP